jgi:hypothetical protein
VEESVPPGSVDDDPSPVPPPEPPLGSPSGEGVGVGVGVGVGMSDGVGVEVAGAVRVGADPAGAVREVAGDGSGEGTAGLVGVAAGGCGCREVCGVAVGPTGVGLGPSDGRAIGSSGVLPSGWRKAGSVGESLRVVRLAGWSATTAPTLRTPAHAAAATCSPLARCEVARPLRCPCTPQP